MKPQIVKLDTLENDNIIDKIEHAAKVLTTNEYKLYSGGINGMEFNNAYLKGITMDVMFVFNKRDEHILYRIRSPINNKIIYYIDLHAKINDRITYIFNARVKLYKEYYHESKRFTKSVIRIYEVIE
jgi:hypothetical protein